MILDILKDIIEKEFKECGYEIDVKITKSNRPDLCDYQCDDAFKLAKTYHKNPIEIGSFVVEKINNYSEFYKYFKKVEFVNPGFINITISDSLINSILNEMITKPNFNLKKPDIKEKFILDYGGPNIAKPLHVGHLRTAIIGESIKRIIKFKGHDTISDVHLGDYGLQIGEVIYGIKQDGLSLDEITLEYLEKTYPKMSKLCKEDESILNECASITKALQEGNLEYKKYWKKITEISLNDIKRLYKYLDVSFDLWLGESDSYEYIDPLTKLLNEKNLLKESENALVIDVEKETDNKLIPPLIFKKSNGAYLYGTTDLATIYQRIKDYNPNHILYITDLRQSLHFEQVFRASKLSGLTTNVSLKHLGYGTVNDNSGKPFKTRNGDAAKLDDLFNQVKEAFISIKDSNKDLKEHDLDIIVNSIIKFADLQNNYEKDYIFDINKFSKVVGKTGPYILYTYLRTNKIINEENKNISLLNDKIYNEFDRNLRLKLLELPLVIDSAFSEYRPSYIAEYVYDICCIDNIFYQNNHIIGSENDTKQQWLLLLSFTNKLIKELLNLLVIDIPSQM
jgi:arginyl-tRNA synthetase